MPVRILPAMTRIHATPRRSGKPSRQRKRLTRSRGGAEEFTTKSTNEGKETNCAPKARYISWCVLSFVVQTYSAAPRLRVNLLSRTRANASGHKKILPRNEAGE